MKRFIASFLLGGIIWAAFFVGPAPASAETWVAARFAGSVVRDVTASADGTVVYAFTTTSLDRSADGGTTWAHLTPPVIPNMLAFSGSTVLIATSSGLYRSTDGGDSWVLASGPLVTFANIRSVAIAKTDPQVAWAQTQQVGGSNSVLKSTNGGATWSLVSTISPSYGTLTAIDPKDAQTVYLTGFQRLYKTTDGGLTWTITLLGGTTDAIAGIAIDPDNPSIIYLSGHPRTVKSTDGGTSFAEFGQGYYANPALPKVSGPISISTEGLYLAGANDGSWIAPGVWKRGSEWAKVSGLEIHVSGLFATTSAVYAATDGGLYKLPLTPPAPPAPPGPDPYPVVVIPGIMGSWVDHGVWKLDPISHTYDGLIASLVAAGYREGTNLFPFPYQWRASNVDTAELLRAKIAAIRAQTGQPKVNLVAHSMGGLVARQYIQGIHYGGDVNKLILIGTPNLGAPNAYLAWEGEDFSYYDFLKAFVLKTSFEVEAENAGYGRLYDYIHQRVPSLGELLPIYDYLKDAGTGLMRHYPTRYPTNPFLENLELNKGLLTARGVETYSLVGDLGDESTPGLLRLTNSSISGIWPDGYPDEHWNPFSDRGVERTNGDGTVPIQSAEELGNLTTFNATHTGLVTAGENEILQLLGRSAGEIRHPKGITRAWLLFVHSPVEISVERDGAPVTPDFYTGPGEEPQIMTQPDPADGCYDLVIRGIGSGSYQVDLAFYDEATEDARVTDTILGQTHPGRVERVPVVVEDGRVYVVRDRTPGQPLAAEAVISPTEQGLSKFQPEKSPPKPKQLQPRAHLDTASVILVTLILGALIHAIRKLREWFGR